MTRNNKIFLALTIGGTSLAYLIYRKIKNDSLYEELLAQIGVGSNFKDSDVWNSNFLLMINNEGRNIKKLSSSELNSYAERMRDAISGAGTDESSIYSVLEAINSKYEIAQLNQYYNQKYNGSLKQALEGDLNEKEMTKANNIILQKPRVIYNS